MTISSRDKKLLIVFGGILLLVLVFFFVCRPTMEKNDVLVQENEALQTRLWDLQAKEAMKDDYLQEVLSIRIDDTLSVDSMLALHAIYLARYESVSLFYGEEENRIRSFCKRRHKEIYDQLAHRLPQVDDIYTRIRVLEAMRELEYRYGSLGTTRDATNFVASNVESLLSQRDRLPASAIDQLLALRYDDIKNML